MVEIALEDLLWGFYISSFVFLKVTLKPKKELWEINLFAINYDWSKATQKQNIRCL